MSDRVRFNIEIEGLGESFELDANAALSVGDLLREISREFEADFVERRRSPLGELWVSGTFRPLSADQPLGRIERTNLIFGAQAPRPEGFDFNENELLRASESLPPNHVLRLDNTHSGEKYPITRTPTLLGRAGNAEAAIRAYRLEITSDARISRVHCALVLRQNIYYIVHLSEQSATYHNDHLLTGWRATPLEDKDMIRLGDTQPPLEFMFRMREK